MSNYNEIEVQKVFRNFGIESSVSIKNNEFQFAYWNRLPDELKLECIENMDLKTRWLFRSTSRTERFLTDSLKFHLDKLTIEILGFGLKVIVSENNERTVMYSTDEDYLKNSIIPFLSFILTHAKIKTFETNRTMGFSDVPFQVLSHLDYSIPYHIEHVLSGPFDMQILFLDRTNEETLKSIEFWIDGNKGFSIEEQLVLVPHETLKFWDIEHLNCGNAASILSEQWIDHDVIIGTKCIFGTNERGTMEDFVSKFQESIVYEISNQEVQIRMSNPEKLIILKLNGFLDPDEFFVLVVVPEGKTDEEYKEYCNFGTLKHLNKTTFED